LLIVSSPAVGFGPASSIGAPTMMSSVWVMHKASADNQIRSG
jgi:hypothetical protein